MVLPYSLSKLPGSGEFFTKRLFVVYQVQCNIGFLNYSGNFLMANTLDCSFQGNVDCFCYIVLA